MMHKAALLNSRGIEPHTYHRKQPARAHRSMSSLLCTRRSSALGPASSCVRQSVACTVAITRSSTPGRLVGILRVIGNDWMEWVALCVVAS